MKLAKHSLRDFGWMPVPPTAPGRDCGLRSEHLEFRVYAIPVSGVSRSCHRLKEELQTVDDDALIEVSVIPRAPL